MKLEIRDLDTGAVMDVQNVDELCIDILAETNETDFRDVFKRLIMSRLTEEDKLAILADYNYALMEVKELNK
jgi:hypothetical protein